ncbi:MBL fold metallo-hydrolase [Amycolatopsis cynarae]|uniref:MBL fold metallo-hydrolase n=1 Tax=Amycolatopsis cynarae TaxID=2995223 RepID=A0ABY7B803_9PSEU|nr:MBL fold metallo-hydrolase [Amycolatopsis sp. HUAS 11-8]WAL68477.1 MBL fold metallo-hydrolase [Amycolatopsis sp. HUAS 11-8]
MPRLILLGVGAMNSPRYRPTGLLVCWAGHRVMLDGGGSADPGEPLDAWFVSDERAELMPRIRRRARELGVGALTGSLAAQGVRLRPLPVRHTSHPTFGYLLETAHRRAAWAPEFRVFPDWAAGVDLMFADAAGWHRPILFAHGAGGHACVTEVAAAARAAGVRRLVFAHIGRPSIRAIDRGERPAFGRWGREGAEFLLT